MASIIGSNTFRVTVRGIAQGQQTVTSWGYYPTVTFLNTDSAFSIAGQWLTNYLTLLLDCLSVNFYVDSILFEKWTGVFWDAYIHPTASPGNVAGECMPVYNSMGLRKLPDNAEIDPVGAQPFRVGATRLPGMPESFQENGVYSSAANTALQALANPLDTFVAGTETWQMYMYRDVDTIPGQVVPHAVPVLGMVLGKPGTQNTRK